MTSDHETAEICLLIVMQHSAAIALQPSNFATSLVVIVWYLVVGNATESKAISKWLDRQTSNGEAKMGNGVQGLFGLCGRIYELTGIMSFGELHFVESYCVIHFHVKLSSVIWCISAPYFTQSEQKRWFSFLFTLYYEYFLGSVHAYCCCIRFSFFSSTMLF